AEVEALSAALAEFGRRYEQALAAPFAALGEAERLTRRLQRLEDEVARLARRLLEGEPEPVPASAPSGRARAGSRRRRRRRKAGPEPFRWHAFEAAPEGEGRGEAAAAQASAEPEAGPGAEVEDEAAALKRVYRRLARVLHPDLATDAAEQARLGDLMARVNAAYAKGDRTTLEVMAEKVGAGEPLGELTPEERLAHLARRAATLGNVAASLRRERAKLERTDTFRLRAEALVREAAGGDWFAETSMELVEEEEAAASDAVARLDRLARAARELGRARRMAMGQIAKRGPTGTTRAFDPLHESALVRKGAALLERQRATGPARELARQLEEAAGARPWEVALSILALFLEESVRPPPSIETGAGFAQRWELLRAEWEGAPDLARALARLPRHLEVGVRAGAAEVGAGLQLTAPELAAGVRIALERPTVAELGRAVLSALGPAEPCKACKEDVVAIHLLRTRGLDELNGLVCPRCGAVQRSYWRYGEPEGLEALAPWALKLGLVAEQGLSLAGTVIGFQMLPEEHEALSAEALRDRFAQLYLAPNDVELDPGLLTIEARGKALKPGAALPAGAVTLGVAREADTTPEALLELLRGRVAQRFKR
ncbi:MAG TPA: J domain-containing protein, partial [Anaeromyxobacteraceae bacterium]|nr:J domain-containing protein [Anaeromyxobacteraceae bacterium]